MSAQASPNTAPSTSAPPAICHARHKNFGPVWANRDIDLTVDKASIHGIIRRKRRGQIHAHVGALRHTKPTTAPSPLDGKEVKIANSTQAIALGVGMVHQHFMLVEPLSALENILLAPKTHGRWTYPKANRAKTQTISERFGLKACR